MGGKSLNYEIKADTVIGPIRNCTSGLCWYDKVPVSHINKKCGAFKLSNDSSAHELKKILGECQIKIKKKTGDSVLKNVSVFVNYWQPPDTLPLDLTTSSNEDQQQKVKVEKDEPIMENQITVHINEINLSCVTMRVYNIKSLSKKRYLVSIEQEGKLFFQYVIFHDQKFEKT